MIDTGGTLVSGAKALKEKGASKVYACCAHGVFAATPLKESVTPRSSNSWLQFDSPYPEAKNCGKIKVLSVARLLAEAIRSIHDETSVSKLFI